MAHLKLLCAVVAEAFVSRFEPLVACGLAYDSPMRADKFCSQSSSLFPQVLSEDAREEGLKVVDIPTEVFIHG